MEVPVRTGRVQSLHEHFQIATPHGLATKALFDGVRGCVFSVHLQSSTLSSGAKALASLSHLVFRNFYTASLRLVQVNRDGTSIVLFEEHPLMQHIHYEDDAQNWHVLPLDKVPIDMSTFESFCVYLFQPSPLWDKWELQNLKLYQARASSASSSISTAASGASLSRAGSASDGLPLAPRATSPSKRTQLSLHSNTAAAASNSATKGDDKLTKRPSRLALMTCVEAKDVQDSATQCLTLVSRLKRLLHTSHHQP